MTIYNILLILLDATAKQINIKFINNIINVIALYKKLSLKDKRPKPIPVFHINIIFKNSFI